MVEVNQQQINILHTNGWFNNYKCSREITYTPIGGSLIINVSVHEHNGGSPGTSSIGFKTIFVINPTIFMVVCQLALPGFTSVVFHPQKKCIVYRPMVASPTINVMVYTKFGGSPKLKVKPFTLVFTGYLNAQHRRLKYIW